jgi:copper chaperone CopZ
MTIKNELAEIKGVLKVEGDVGKKTIAVAFEAPASLKEIKDKLNEINYPSV